ncbi:MAG: hypothetical protein R3E31_30010 [Chloroflexota bacterium]
MARQGGARRGKRPFPARFRLLFLLMFTENGFLKRCQPGSCVGLLAGVVVGWGATAVATLAGAGSRPAFASCLR